MRINPYLQKQLTLPGSPSRAGSDPSQPGFLDELKSSIEAVDRMQHGADQAMQEGAVQGATHIDETMIKLEEADISLRMLVKVRNKALDAYQEIMRMQF